MPVYLLSDEIVFPNPENSDSTGLVAVGGDLSVDRLLLAYKMGIFPWYSEGDPILWFSPDPRMVFFLKDFKPSRSLLKLVNSNKYEVRFDSNFKEVIENCANVPRKNQTGTWITSEMKDAYTKLHDKGYAHSVETYIDNNLVGGLYGISLGGAFFGESMFYFESNASKIAFYSLVEKCKSMNFDFIDSQVSTDHMKKFGALDIPREDFLILLKNTLKNESSVGNWSN